MKVKEVLRMKVKGGFELSMTICIVMLTAVMALYASPYAYSYVASYIGRDKQFEQLCLDLQELPQVEATWIARSPTVDNALLCRIRFENGERTYVETIAGIEAARRLLLSLDS